MKRIKYILNERISPYVNCIMASESPVATGSFKIPIYADGYPGIMFQQSQNGFYLQPKNKPLSELFLFGQTLEPISLEVQGPFKLVVFQLYPFASKYLLGIDPRTLNDDCYDLLQLKHIDSHQYRQNLITCPNLNQQIEIISEMIEQLICKNQVSHDDRIHHVISHIIKTGGRIKIKELGDDFFLTERTLERQFLNEVGLTPKQFAKIIQFQTSLTKLTKAHFKSLTHVGLDSGFTDQSHFIRVFKQYTGQTPSYYLKNAQTMQ